MPIYTYHCTNCNATGDYLVPAIGSSPAACSGCGEEGRLERVLQGQTVSAVSKSSGPNVQQKPKDTKIIITNCPTCYNLMCKAVDQLAKRQNSRAAAPLN